jgi:hydrogenase expression/formation protein HypE
VLWFEPGISVCQALGADPWSTLASGTLLAVFPPEAAATALPALADQGIGQPSSAPLNLGQE